jgi:oligogalacturonide lyase
MISPSRRVIAIFRSVALTMLATLTGQAWAQEPPSDWIDGVSGHRIIRLSREAGTASFYFHQNAYTEKGDKMVVSVKGGLATIDLTTLGTAPPKVEQIVQGAARGAIVGRKSRQVYYVQGRSLHATHLDTRATRKLADLPAGLSSASGLALNADETLLASTGTDPKAHELARDRADPRAGKERSMVLFTIDVKTGEIRRIHYSVNWLNHTQFSPTDPERILFCHEGTWDYVDRIWTIRTDGTDLRKMHTRTMEREIAGHEFFGHDGKWVWYDLQTPRSTEFWLAGVSLSAGERIRYKVTRPQWSVHYTQSPDGTHFAGDGGGPASVANRALNGAPLGKERNGQWIYLFTPTGAIDSMRVGSEDVKVGQLKAEVLVDLSKHAYKLEPNVSFTPDSRWVVFRSNMHGPTHVYAAKVATGN